MFALIAIILLGVKMGLGEEVKISEGVIFQHLADVKFYENRHVISMGISKRNLNKNFAEIKVNLDNLELTLRSLNISRNLRPRAMDIVGSLMNLCDKSVGKWGNCYGYC